MPPKTIRTETEIPAHLTNYERAAFDLEGAQTLLTETYLKMQNCIAAVEGEYLPEIRKLAGLVARRRAALLANVAEHPADWERPKSTVLHGWKLGWRKQPGTLFVDDEPSVIAKLRAVLKAAAAPLIRVKESLDKAALRDQPADVLAKCGVTLAADTDEPFVTRVGGDVEKAVADLLKRAEAREAARAQRN